MEEQIRILLIEPSVKDAERIECELRKDNAAVTVKRVSVKNGFISGLKKFNPDIIIADCEHSRFSCLEALNIVHGSCSNLPFLVISDALHKEAAEECIRWGAVDFILKDSLPRLPSAVKNAIEKKLAIEKRLEAEKKFRDSEKKYRTLFENNTDFVFTLDLSGSFTDVNKAAEKISGFSKDELIGLNYSSYILPEDRGYVEKAFRSILETGKPILDFPLRTLVRGNIVKYFETSVSPLWDGNNIIGFQGTTRDVTDRKKTQDELLEAEKMWKSLVENSPEFIIIIDEQGGIRDMNRTASGVEKGAVIGKRIYGFLLPEHKETFRQTLKTVFQTGTPGMFEMPIKIGSESMRWFECRAVPVKRGNEVVEAMIISLDISGRKIAEHEIKKLSQFRENIIDSANIWLYVLNEQGDVLIWNKAAETISGYSRNEAIGHDLIWQWLYPEETYRQETLSRIQQIIDSSQQAGDYETVIQSKSGEEKVISWNSKSLVDVRGELIGSISLGRDITKQKRAEAELRKLYSTVEQSQNSIMITDIKGNIEYVNQKFLDVTGYTKEEVAGENLRFLKSGDLSPEESTQFWETITSGNEWQGEFHNRSKSGEMFWEFASISPIRNERGDITHFAVIKEDITERKKMEQMVIHSEKMASIGTLAAGIAHEINNPVGYIKGNLHTMQKYLERFVSYNMEVIQSLSKSKHEHTSSLHDHVLRLNLEHGIDFVIKDIRDAISESLEGTESIKRIISDLRIFSRLEKSDIRLADINEAIKKTLNIVENELKQKAKIELILGNIPEIECDIYKISQVFLNLLVNAAQAIDERGTITIKSWESRNYVVIQFSDSGSGIPKEVIGKVFDAFFTTKDPGKGTGLGLSIAYKIIQNHKGTVDVVSEEGQGTTFTIKLPKKGDVVSQRKILIVDDDQSTRKILTRFVQLYDATIMIKAAKDGFEAADILNTFEPGVVLLDINMPGINGLDVCRRIMTGKLKETTKVIVVTGIGEKGLRNKSFQAGAFGFIKKPLKSESLFKVLDKAYTL
ncbi:PAS domain S-box protein [candidate division KSB1 bacterium]